MHIVIGVTSSIAIVKIPALIKLLLKSGHTLDVMMTNKASYLLSPGKIEELIGKSVYVNLFEDSKSYEYVQGPHKIDHIDLATRADLFVIAPATANTIAKMAHGIADDFITTSLLATQAPTLVCPAMNTNMWTHPATRENIDLLERFGYEIMTPSSGELACGTTGVGRLPEPQEIADHIEMMLSRKSLLKGKTVLVTGGGTEEPIDAVRTLSNRSSGKMGKAIAEACFRYGAQVIFLHSRQGATSHLPITRHSFSTAESLKSLIHKHIAGVDIMFHSAAVSDFMTTPNKGKLDSGQPLTLELKPAPKIINDVKKKNPRLILVGFKAISLSSQTKRTQRAEIWDPKHENGVLEQVRNDSQKLFSDALADFVVVNDVGRDDIGFGSDENEVYVVTKDGAVSKISKTTKVRIAKDLIRMISEKIN